MNATKQRMLAAARTLLLDKGVEATAVEDILKATETGKSQFYHFFGSKSGMVTAVLEEVHQELVIGGMWQGEKLPDLTEWDGLRPWLEAVARNKGRGHPLALLALTIRPEERSLYPSLQSLYLTLRAPLLMFLEKQREIGRLLAQVNAADLADLALTALIGATIHRVIRPGGDDPVVPAIHHLYLYLKAYARA